MSVKDLRINKGALKQQMGENTSTCQLQVETAKFGITCGNTTNGQ